jgi:SAM-dependent methyltransferase
MRVDPLNAAQFRYWDGEEGAYWAKRAARFDMGASDYLNLLLVTADINQNEVVLDIGCGTGVMTRLAACVGRSALGVDLSRAMIEVARREAAYECQWNVVFRQGDAQVYPFSTGRYGVAISRHGAMFFGDPHAAFINIARALHPDGRMVLLSWQPLERNEWQVVIRDALFAGREPPAPSTQPGTLKEPDDIVAVLTRAGFTDVRITSVTASMYFGADARRRDPFPGRTARPHTRRPHPGTQGTCARRPSWRHGPPPDSRGRPAGLGVLADRGAPRRVVLSPG